MSFKDTIKKMLSSKPASPKERARDALISNGFMLPIGIMAFAAFINAQSKPEIREAVGVDAYNTMGIIGTGMLVLMLATSAANAFYAWRRAKRSEIKP